MKPLLILLLFSASQTLTSCAHQGAEEKLKVVQVFNQNSGSNYVFESKK